MKTILSCLMLLAFLISNGQETQYWKGKVPADDSVLIVNTNKALQEMKVTGKVNYAPLTVTAVSSPRQLSVTGNYNPIGTLYVTGYVSTSKPKYDTVRVLVAYADTTEQQMWRITGFENWSAKYIEVPRSLHWSFVYSIREFIDGGYVTGSRLRNATYQVNWIPKNIKYLTEDKKDIPRSWVVLIEKSL